MNSPALVSLLVALVALAVAAAALYLQQRSRRAGDGRRSKTPSQQQPFSPHAKVLENCNDVAWLFDAKSKRLLYVSPSVERLRGWNVADLIGKSAQELVPLHIAGRIDDMIDELTQQQKADPSGLAAARIEIEVPRKDGSAIPVETEYKVLQDDTGEPTLLLGISRDISERRRIERTLREAEERVRLALQCSGDGVWDINLQSRDMSYVEGWGKVLGYQSDEVEPTIDGYIAMIHEEDRDKVLTEISRHISGELPSYHCEFRIHTKDSGWRWVLSRGLLWSRTEDGQPLRMIGTHTDITSRKVAEVAMSRANIKLHTQIDEIRTLQMQLAELAIRDPLTGLYNRRYLDETMEREVARARREGHPLSVVMLDVDHFKNLNDSYGHQAGDQVLKALGDLLGENTRAEDVACRYGGEEFLVLLPRMPLDKARERAEYWRGQLEKHTFLFGNFSLSATASFGVSGYPHHGKTTDELTRAADTALYSAKRNGRNRVEMFEEEPIVFVTGTTISEVQ